MIVFESLTEDKLKQLYEESNVDVTNKDVIEDIRRWCTQQSPYLPESLFEDLIVVKYTVYCKNTEVAKEKLIQNFRTKIEYPNVFLIDPLDDNFAKNFMSLRQLLLPKLTPDGFGVVCVQPSADPTVTDLFDMVVCVNSMISVSMRQNTMNAGYVVLVDFNGTTMQHIVKITPAVFKLLTLWIKNLPFPVKCMVYVNVNVIVGKLINMVSSMMKEKIKDRIYVYSGGVEQFLHHVPKDTLPIELGGTDFTMQDIRDIWYDKLKEHRQMFSNERDILKKYVHLKIASRRRSRASSLGEVAAEGIHGAFISLNID